MDFVLAVRKRLNELGLGQRDLANGAEVTESYISQILGRKKLPPLPNRTDLYDKMSRLLKVPREELGRLAVLQHRELLDRELQAPPAPTGPMRDLILQKCRPARQKQMRAIFEKQLFGEMERLITRSLIEAVRDEARGHGLDYAWLHSLSGASGQSYRRMRVRMIELLESEPGASIGDFSEFIDPLVLSWDFDVDEFTMQVELTSGATRRYAFQPQTTSASSADEPGFQAFLRDAKLAAGITADEVSILRGMRFPEKLRPSPLFYYRILQTVRDPVHFRERKKKKV